jgi:hypothetical protein
MHTRQSQTISMRVQPAFMQAIDKEIDTRKQAGWRGHACTRSAVIQDIVQDALGILKPGAKTTLESEIRP